MNHRFLLYTAAAALLLTGCAGSGPDTQEETAPQTTAQTGSEPENMASETQENAVSETQTTLTAESSTEPALTESVPAVTAPPMSIVIRQATAVTYTTAVTTQKTAAASQSEKPNIQSRYMMNPEPYYKAGKEVSLAGKGTVFSEDGLNLRTKPSESSEVIAAFPKHTQVEVLGAVFSGDCSLAQNRWYHVKVNGKEGYMGAKYLAVQFTQPADQLSDEQACYLTAMCVYQFTPLKNQFRYYGGMDITGYDETMVHYGGDRTLKDKRIKYNAVLPASVTLESIQKSFSQYFTLEWDGGCYLEDGGYCPSYITENGRLYIYTDQYVIPDQAEPPGQKVQLIRTVENKKINADVHITEQKMIDSETNRDDLCIYKFEMLYEDGCWKHSYYF